MLLICISNFKNIVIRHFPIEIITVLHHTYINNYVIKNAGFLFMVHFKVFYMFQTQEVYKWLQPKICREDVSEAARLPPASEKHECPPCNPGMDYRNGSTCEFCPKDMYSDGKTSCKRCPPNTTPNYGYHIHHWTEMPKMMSAACMEVDGKEL
jgi:hypothetical protein